VGKAINLRSLGAPSRFQAGAGPSRFIPVFSPLTREAMEQAETADFDGVPFRVARADHLAVIALSVGRAKDFSVSREEIERLARGHRLSEAWQRFVRRFFDE